MLVVFLFVFGLSIGSFLGVLSYRLPRNLNITSDRSRCDSCNKVIAWYDNIPLLSFLILQGKCRNCDAKISHREPLIELVTAITFAIIGLNILNLILACILITIFIIDLENQIIPDSLVFAGLVIFILFNILFGIPFYDSLLAGFLGADILLFLNLITKGKGMGMGDVKLAILLGSVTGLRFFLVWLFFSFLSGSIIGILLIIIKKASFKERIAFGPFLIIGLALTFIFGTSFISLLGL